MTDTVIDEGVLAQARQILMVMVGDAPTPKDIRDHAERVIGLLGADGPGMPSVEQLARDVERRCNVVIGEAVSLEDSRGHEPWLDEQRETIEWKFWTRYRRHLREHENLGPGPIRSTDRITDDILSKLEWPKRPGAWDRRGLVVGQVQSGKTSNYTGLICKAADAGYKLIIVLAGVHNSLRSQTQLRLDEGFLGFDTQNRMQYGADNRRMGVGTFRDEDLHIVHSLTNSAENGDFNIRVARQGGVRIGGDPVLLVVKKNASVLRNIQAWATSIDQVVDADGRAVVRGVPLLVIDDEADYASVNTRKLEWTDEGEVDPEFDPARINGLIRKLLHTFEQSAYVGYTATPFANVLIHEDAASPTYGDDLFPRSFIINLPPPSNYIGPSRVFGLAGDSEAQIESVDPLPIFRPVDQDYEDWIADRHKVDYAPGPLPESLKEAMLAFMLTCAARAARGDSHRHNSMLVHVTRFVDVQQQVADQIEAHLAYLQDQIRYGGGSSDILRDELRFLWETDFMPTTEAIDDEDCPVQTWAEIEPFLKPSVAKIRMRRINGSSADVLDYHENRLTGINVIAVGGDKLSRGLTLEGLSVSYYLRATQMYDTLMQMGRWFGYRPRFVDLCRLYTTTELRGWYRDVALANEELVQQFDHMAELRLTPTDFGLKIRSHPAGLLVTGPAKMRDGAKVRLSFDGAVAETVVFHTDSDIRESNIDAVAALMRRLGGPDSSNATAHLWERVDHEEILGFLAAFKTHPAARKVHAETIRRYIEAQVAHGELTTWTIALRTNRGDLGRPSIGNLPVGWFERQGLQVDDDRVTIRRLLSPTDEAIDLNDEARERALRVTRGAWQLKRPPGRDEPTEPSGPALRAERPASRGLLLVYPLTAEPYASAAEEAGLVGDVLQSDLPYMGIGLSFPSSGTAKGIEYVVNSVKRREIFE